LCSAATLQAFLSSGTIGLFVLSPATTRIILPAEHTTGEQLYAELDTVRHLQGAARRTLTDEQRSGRAAAVLQGASDSTVAFLCPNWSRMQTRVTIRTLRLRATRKLLLRCTSGGLLLLTCSQLRAAADFWVPVADGTIHSLHR